MRKRLLIFLVILIGFSCVGLVLIQFHWMNKSVEIGTLRFKNTALNSINKVVFNLEQEVRTIYLKELRKENEEKAFLYKQIENNLPLEIKFNKTKDSSLVFLIKTNLIHSYNEADGSVIKKDTAENIKKEIVVTLFADHYSPEKRIYKVVEHADFLSESYPVKLSVPFSLIDTMISESLRENQLYNRFIIGFYDTLSKTFLNQCNASDSLLLFSNSYMCPLFINDDNQSNVFLMVYFPDGSEFVFNQAANFLWTSLIFVFIISVSFAIALSIIFKQRKLSEIKNDFINNMTHEIKTPIATISLATEAMNDGSVEKDTELQKAYLRIIKEENNRLQLLVAQILDQARLDSTTTNLKKEPVNVQAVIEKCIENIKLILEQREGSIDVDFRSKDPVINADPIHLTNVICNLLDNAVKYSPVKPKLYVSIIDTPSGIEISVKDNGIGIHKREQKKIFDKFYRVSTGNVHDVKGYGVGLSYVKYAIQLFGGSIRVESDLDKGSTFVINLPKEIS